MPKPRLVKLVRDGIGQFLDDDTVTYEPIEDEAVVIDALRRKLVEEAIEYMQNPSLGELADVYEVMRALAHHDLNVAVSSVGVEAIRKMHERGGFDKGMGMFVQTTAPSRHE